MTNETGIADVLSAMAERFTSGNEVPVGRATITRNEWDMVTARMSLLECRMAALAALHYGAPDALPVSPQQCDCGTFCWAREAERHPEGMACRLRTEPQASVLELPQLAPENKP